MNIITLYTNLMNFKQLLHIIHILINGFLFHSNHRLMPDPKKCIKITITYIKLIQKSIKKMLLLIKQLMITELHILHPQLQYFIYEFSLVHIWHLYSYQTADCACQIYDLVLFFFGIWIITVLFRSEITLFFKYH